MLKRGDLVKPAELYTALYSDWSSKVNCHFIEDITAGDICLVVNSRRWVFDELTDCAGSRGIKILTPRGKIGYTYIQNLTKIR